MLLLIYCCEVRNVVMELAIWMGVELRKEVMTRKMMGTIQLESNLNFSTLSSVDMHCTGYVL